MKGLLIKDIELTFINKQMLVILFIIGGILLLFGNEENRIMAIAYVSVMCGVMSITSLSYDEYDHSNAFLLTMPISRKIYTVEKYIFMYGALLVGWIVSVGAGLAVSLYAQNEIVWGEWWGSCLGVFFMLSIVLAIMFPILLKFGADRSRMVMMGFFVVIILAVSFGKKAMELLNIDIAKIINISNKFIMEVNILVLLITAIVILGIAIAISMAASMRIMKKKQF